MNLRTFDKYSHIQFDLERGKKIQSYKNLGLALDCDNTFIVIEELLTRSECQNIVNKTIGHYNNLKMEYLPQQRDSERILNMNQEMVDIVYDRIKHVIEEESSKKELKPFGFGTDGKWKHSGINPCFRHSVYHAPSVGFVPHRDSAYIENADIRSVFTLVMYLNDNFDGGETVFIRPKGQRQIGQIVSEELENGYDIIQEYKPLTGTAILFNHNVIHVAKPLITGSKYIIRSDILFERTEPLMNDDWKIDPYFLEAIELYREAGNQEMKGNVEEAGILYEKGLALRQFH